MMQEDELQRYLYKQIPLSKAMEVEVDSVSDSAIVLRAPLAPNINHRETLFGGSASAIAILAAWSLVHTRLQKEGMTRHIIIRRNTMHYEQPVHDGFTARSYLASPADWPAFIDGLEKKGMARISVAAELESQGQRAGRLSAEFVALDQTMLGRLAGLNSLKASSRQP